MPAVGRAPETSRALSLVRRAVRSAGFDVIRYDATHFAHLRRRELLDRHGITVVLDVGANVGEYVTRDLREACYQGRIVSFEPHEDAFRELERLSAADPRWEIRRQAL